MSATPPLTAAQFAVWADFVLAYTRTMRLVEGRLRSSVRLTWAQYDVLYNLHSHVEGRMSVGELSKSLLYSSGSASNLIRSMVTAGLVERSVSTHDRRVSVVALTGLGRETAETATSQVLEVVGAEFAAKLGETELPAVADFLRRIRSADSGLREPPYELPAQLAPR
ncbi:MarR family transcriptional regulator [Herbiconiux sp.]|uniref:MarR family winged helix-turn-helix transcriptional regulator n=1 Tax=Herbiconiux sp. TaxID=1871186 RepID=UPI0025C2E1E6|nr:MarR family transcriptional regulator [Herbiconiux sp.]